jgi:hypothetical protein
VLQIFLAVEIINQSEGGVFAMRFSFVKMSAPELSNRTFSMT